MRLGKNFQEKGQYDKVDYMRQLADKLTDGTNNGLASCYLTEGYKGFDAFAIIANRPHYTTKEGFVVYDLDNNKPIFIQEDEE
jgi:hypothetical protein